jgi:hypothetical protein
MQKQFLPQDRDAPFVNEEKIVYHKLSPMDGYRSKAVLGTSQLLCKTGGSVNTAYTISQFWYSSTSRKKLT